MPHVEGKTPRRLNIEYIIIYNGVHCFLMCELQMYDHPSRNL